MRPYPVGHRGHPQPAPRHSRGFGPGLRAADGRFGGAPAGISPARATGLPRPGALRRAAHQPRRQHPPRQRRCGGTHRTAMPPNLPRDAGPRYDARRRRALGDRNIGQTRRPHPGGAGICSRNGVSRADAHARRNRQPVARAGRPIRAARPQRRPHPRDGEHPAHRTQFLFR